MQRNRGVSVNQTDTDPYAQPILFRSNFAFSIQLDQTHRPVDHNGTLPSSYAMNADDDENWRYKAEPNPPDDNAGGISLY